MGASARDPDAGPACQPSPQRRGDSGWQEEPRLTEAWMLGVASRRVGGAGERTQGGGARGRGGPGGGRVEDVSQQVLRVALLTVPLALLEPRKVCHPFEER